MGYLHEPRNRNSTPAIHHLDKGAPMRILVTGGLGPIGLPLVKELRKRGHSVWSSDVFHDHDRFHVRCDVSKFRQLNDYALTKWVSEIQVMNHSRMANTENVRVRLFNTYGPGEHFSPFAGAVCMFAYSALQSAPYEVYLNHRRTFTYLTDAVRTLANIVSNFHPGEAYNIAGREHHDIKYVSDLVLNLLGKSDGFVIYKETEPFTTKEKKTDITKAIRDLDHRPAVALEDGVRYTLEWMKAAYGETKPVMSLSPALASPQKVLIM